MSKVKRTIFTLAVFGLLLFSISGCGVMFGGSKFSGTMIVKDHPNAEIYVNGQRAGRGTSIGLYPRNHPVIVEVKQEGCEAKTQTFPYAFRTGNFILSLVSWGAVGLIVDLSSGAAYKPDHNKNAEIQQVSYKDFTFNLDYSECPPN